MAKVKINTEKTATKEQIEKAKNFDQFITGYKKFYSYRSMRLLYKRRRLFTLIIVILILVAILLFDKLV